MYRTYKIAATREIKLNPDSEVGLITPSKRKEIRDISDERLVRRSKANFDRRR
jgi:hypothetical protein